jgi:electron transfer flavoprotein beta subunit
MIMNMRFIVCLKPVPDPKHWNRLTLDPETKTLIRDGIPCIINPLDRKALEEALQLRERGGGEVIVLSMAPPYTTPVLREALAMGADGSILLSDPSFGGSDTLATSYIMATAIKKLAPYHLILCGDQTLDGSTGQVSTQIAEFLDIPNLIHVKDIEILKSGVFRVRSQIEQGYMCVEIKPPMVLSVSKEINEPRYITFLNILEAEKKEIKIWSSKDLSLCEPWVGLTGSPSQMADLSIPTSKRKGEILQGTATEMAKILAERLRRLGYC